MRFLVREINRSIFMKIEHGFGGMGGGGEESPKHLNELRRDPEIEALATNNVAEKVLSGEEAALARKGAEVKNELRKKEEEIRGGEKQEKTESLHREIEPLKAKVSELRKEYYAAAKRLSEHRDRQREQGLLAKIKRYLFSPEGQSSSGELDDVMLKSESIKSLEAYRNAKKELRGKQEELARLEGKDPNDIPDDEMSI